MRNVPLGSDTLRTVHLANMPICGLCSGGERVCLSDFSRGERACLSDISALKLLSSPRQKGAEPESANWPVRTRESADWHVVRCQPPKWEFAPGSRHFAPSLPQWAQEWTSPVACFKSQKLNGFNASSLPCKLTNTARLDEQFYDFVCVRKILIFLL